MHLLIRIFLFLFCNTVISQQPGDLHIVVKSYVSMSQLLLIWKNCVSFNSYANLVKIIFFKCVNLLLTTFPLTNFEMLFLSSVLRFVSDALEIHSHTYTHSLLKANNIIFSEAVKGNKAVLGIIYNSNNFYQRVLRLGSCGLVSFFRGRF